MMTKRKILFINHSVRDGGPGKSLFYILKYLDRDKLEPFVLIPKDDVFSETLKSEGIYKNIIVDERFPENIQRPRLNVQNKKNLIDKFKFLSQLTTIISIIINFIDLILLVNDSKRVIKKCKIDVIYCNGTVAKIFGALMGKRNSVPVIWHVRNIQQTSFLKFTMKYLSRLGVVKKIISVSNATALQFGEVKNKVHVVYNGIDCDDFNDEKTVGALRKEFSISQKTIVIGNTGRIVKRKGYKNFVRLAKDILSSESEKDIKFVIVGDTPYFFPQNHLDEIKRYVKDLGIEEHFIFTGYKGDIKPYLKDFDIFVIPSNYPDPFPRSVIEAMAFSLPVIGFRIGGISEAIKQGETGFLCEPNNYDEMKNGIELLIENEKLRKEMGINSKKRVVDFYSANEKAKDIEGIILSVGLD